MVLANGQAKETLELKDWLLKEFNSNKSDEEKTAVLISKSMRRAVLLYSTVRCEIGQRRYEGHPGLVLSNQKSRGCLTSNNLGVLSVAVGHCYHGVLSREGAVFV